MKSNITQLIDFSKIDVLLESFNKSTGFVTAILDLEGNILSKSGWRKVCTEFHRKHTVTSQNCLISDTVLANKMAEGEKYHFYKCMNGLVDVAMPIMLNGEHVANLFTGQFFVEEPDIEFFRKQAQKYGFDEEKYLNYLSKVPVVSEEKVKANLDFLHLMTQFISERSVEKEELRQAKEQADETNAIITAIIEGTVDSIWAFDRDYNIIYINHVFQRDFMASFGVLLQKGSNLLASLPEIIRPLWKPRYEKVLAGDQFNIIDELETAVGRTFIQVTFNPIVNNGEVIGASCFGSNITGRKQMELQQAELHRKMSTMIGNLEGIVYRCSNDPDWPMEYMSEGCYKLTGYKISDFIEDKTLTFNDIIHPDYRELLWAEWQKVLAEHKHMVYEYPIITKNAEIKWVWEQGCGVYSDSGEVIALEGLITDITERKKAEIDLQLAKEQAEENEKHFKLLFESNADGITILKSGVEGLSGRILQYNENAARQLGYTVDEFLLIDVTTLEANTNPQIQSLRMKDLAGKGEITYETELKHKNGYLIPVEVKALLIKYFNHPAVMFITRDISERKRTENALKDEKDRIRTILDLVGDPIFVKDDQHRVTLANNAFYDIFCLNEADVLGSTLVGKVTKNEKEHFITVDRQVLDTGLTDVREEELTVNNETKQIITRKIRFVDDSGNRFIVGSIHDITERKRAEAQLRKLSQAVEQSPVSIVITDTGGIIEYVNPTFTKSTGYTQAEAVGKNPSVLKSGEQSKEFYEELWATITSGNDWKGEFHNKKKNGELYWEAALISPIKNRQGEIVNYLAIKENVTERKQSEAQLRKLSQAVEQNSASVVIMDTEGAIEYVNPYFTSLTGYTYHAVQGTKLRIFNKGKLTEKDYKDLINSMHAGKEWRGEYQNRKKNGEFYWEQVVISPIMNENAEITNLVAICENVDERKKMEQQLGNTMAQLQKFATHIQKVREDEKTSLAREIHDDLGQLLVAMKIDVGLTRMQIDKALKVSKTDEIKLRLSNHIDMITKAIMSARRIMNGLRPVRLELLGFSGAAQEYIVDFAARYAIDCESKIDFEIKKLDDDRSLALYRILQESLMNVVKHANATKVEIVYQQIAGDLLFEVADNGVGFIVGKDARDDSYGLIGISERVSILNGVLKIESSPGCGTKVSVRFKLE